MTEKAQRKPISKALRFEVFKRDKFTCQYCGEHAPTVVLQIDHIHPVAQGGDNNILNLITSCFSCNSGKRDKSLEDKSVIEKQHKQLSLLQEKREQFELMLEWKKSLAQMEQDVVQMVADYINSKMVTRSLNENGLSSVAKWIKKFGVEPLLDAIDTSAAQYLVFENGTATDNSASLFINKIPGIIVVRNMPIVKQKIAYAKGIGRNRFAYWSEATAAIIFDNYVRALEQQGWDSEKIANDIECEVYPVMKAAKNWSAWKSQMEKWTEDINGWETPSTQPPTPPTPVQIEDLPSETLQNHAQWSWEHRDGEIKAAVYLGRLFSGFKEHVFLSDLYTQINLFLQSQKELFEANAVAIPEEDDSFTDRFLAQTNLHNHADVPDDIEFEESVAFVTLQEKFTSLIDAIFHGMYLPSRKYTRKDMISLLALYQNECSKRASAP